MINGSGEILRALGRLEGTQAIVLHEVRDIRRAQISIGERVARVEAVVASTPPVQGKQASRLDQAVSLARWSAALAALIGGLAANWEAERIAGLALAFLKP